MKDLFDQYQPTLIQLANDPYFKDKLDIAHVPTNNKILKVFPNGVAYESGKNVVWNFWGTDVILKKLFDERLLSDAYVFDRDSQMVYEQLLLKKHFSNRVAWLDNPFNTGAGDGHLRAVDGVWSNVRGASTANDNTDYTSTSLRLDGLRSGSNRFIGRGRLPFDTSALGDTDTITSATVQVNCSSVNGSFNDSNQIYLDNVSSALAAFTTLTANDYDNFGTTVQSDSQFDCSTTGLKSISLNATGIASISKTSFTDWGLRSYEDHNNSEPVNDGDGSQCSIDTSEHATPSLRPLLTVITPALSAGNKSYAFFM